jgi:hypothetical protein
MAARIAVITALAAAARPDRAADWYLLFPNPAVTESLLDRLINTSHRVFMDGLSFRPGKRPGRVIPAGRQDIR